MRPRCWTQTFYFLGDRPQIDDLTVDPQGDQVEGRELGYFRSRGENLFLTNSREMLTGGGVNILDRDMEDEGV